MNLPIRSARIYVTGGRRNSGNLIKCDVCLHRQNDRQYVLSKSIDHRYRAPGTFFTPDQLVDLAHTNKVLASFIGPTPPYAHLVGFVLIGKQNCRHCLGTGSGAYVKTTCALCNGTGEKTNQNSPIPYGDSPDIVEAVPTELEQYLKSLR